MRPSEQARNRHEAAVQPPAIVERVHLLQYVMGSIRQIKRTGKWELAVRHPQLPKGRKFFTFDTEDDAKRYSDQWAMMVKAGLPLPASLLKPEPVPDGTLGMVLRMRANADDVAPSDVATLELLLREVGGVKFSTVTFEWTSGWVRDMKLKQNLAPSSIRKRVGSLSRAIDDYLRKMPNVPLANALKLLPPRYSQYTERDAAMLKSSDRAPKEDTERDRRLRPGEEQRIEAALRGEKRADRERPLRLPHGEAALILFKLIVNTGLRLREAYLLRRENVDLVQKVIKAQRSKLWHGKVAYKKVPITPVLYTPLKRYVEASSEPLLFPFWNGEEPLIKVSGRLSKMFATAFTYAECEDITEHDLRHEATCRWFEMRGKDGAWLFRTEEIHNIMGWSPNSKMSQRYASFRGEDLASRMWAAE